MCYKKNIQPVSFWVLLTGINTSTSFPIEINVGQAKSQYVKHDLQTKTLQNFEWRLIFIGSTDTEAEVPILRPPDVQRWLTGKDPDVGKDWGQVEKRVTEDENGWMVSLIWRTWVWANSGGSWHAAVHRVTESDTTEWLKNNLLMCFHQQSWAKIVPIGWMAGPQLLLSQNGVVTLLMWAEWPKMLPSLHLLPLHHARALCAQSYTCQKKLKWH